VTCKTPYLWKKGAPHAGKLPSKKPVKKLRVVVLDCGVKYNILRLLENNGCEVLVLPASSSGKEILRSEAGRQSCFPTAPVIRRLCPI
jgi:carbamoyl-phosphate synthase small subunit